MFLSVVFIADDIRSCESFQICVLFDIGHFLPLPEVTGIQGNPEESTEPRSS